MVTSREAGLRASLRTVSWVRLASAPFALLQVLTFYRPYPGHMREIGLVAVGTLAIGAVALLVATRRARSETALGRVRAASVAFDFAAIFAFVTVYAFDQDTAMFAATYLIPLEGAIFWMLPGALWSMAAATAAYTAREAWAHVHYGYSFDPSSITFRMGIGFLIAWVVGSMARRWNSEHGQVVELLRHERRAVEALRTLDEVRDTFLSAVSHELRTPLTSILGFAVTLQDSAHELTDAHRGLLDVIAEQSFELDRLLADLLDIDRLMRGEITARQEEVDVAELIRETARQMVTRERRAVDVELDGDIRAVVDPRMVERIVDNLLRNAAKYTPAGTRIGVRVASDDQDLLIVVDDDGPGVPTELRDAIFEPFRRGSPTLSAHSPGTGIGLSLVQRYARAQGGDAWVVPSAAGGAAFHVRIRCADDTVVPSGSARAANP